MDLAGALGLGERELVAFVGAGGKKTAMAHLVRQATERGRRVGYTTTTHMPPPADVPLIVHEHASALLAELEDAESPLAFAEDYVENPERAETKLAGHDPSTIDHVFDAGRFDWLLVKADGARRREFKAPGPDEPMIPGGATHVVPVASVDAVGRSLDETTVHRPERIAAITGLEIEDEITAETIGTVLASEDGGCKGAPADAAVTPMVNKADTERERDLAHEAVTAALAHRERFDRAIVCSFEADYLEIIEP